jgi:hypothetical protein
MDIDGYEALNTLLKKSFAYGERFTSSGTFNVPSDCYTVDVVIVGAGGNAGHGGGGGGEIVLCKNLSVIPSASIPVVVGSAPGGYSAFGGLIASGGDTVATLNTYAGGGSGQNKTAGGGPVPAPGVNGNGYDSLLTDALSFNENIIAIRGGGGGRNSGGGRSGGNSPFGISSSGVTSGGASWGDADSLYGGGGGSVGGQNGIVLVTYKKSKIL